MKEIEKNQQVADQICHDFRWKDRGFAVGDCVALLDGQIVAVTKNLDDALRELRSADPDAKRGMVFEVRRPVVDVIR